MIQSGPSSYPRNRRWKKGRRTAGTTRQTLDQEMPLFDEDWLVEGGGTGRVDTRRDAEATSNGEAPDGAADGSLSDVASAAVLTLGGSSLLVRVHPETPSPETDSMPSAETELKSSPTIPCVPLAEQLDAASAEVEGAADREVHAARRRSALLEAMEASEVCETSIAGRSGREADSWWADQSDSFEPVDRGSAHGPRNSPHSDRHHPDSMSTCSDAVSVASDASSRSSSVHRKPEPPFRWRRMWATAVCSGGAGCIALLIGHVVGI